MLDVVRRDRAKLAGLEVFKCLSKFVSCIHHKRTIGGNGLADGLAAEEENIKGLMAFVLALIGSQGNGVSLTKDS